MTGPTTAAPDAIRSEWLGAWARAILRPRPRLTLSEWADQYRVLSRKASAEPGQWHTDRAPYQRAIMDAMTDPLVERVVFMKSAQVGATEMLTNAVGYAIDQDPGPVLVVQPNLDMARSWSTDRLKPMLRESPVLVGRVQESNRRHSGDTILHKEFAGGHLSIVGANSASGLASRPIRYLFLDEVDRYPPSAGREGDPVALAFARTATFSNRKLLLSSTPTIKGASRIEVEWEQSDQRFYLVACPDCGHRQRLAWGQLKWEPGQPDTAAMACTGCGVMWQEHDKGRLLAGGEWTASQPGKRAVGFHVNALYSPWATWASLAEKWEAVAGDPTRLQTFINLVLGEPWEDTGGTMSPDAMAARGEDYTPERIPAGVTVLVAGVDIQEDRIEYLVVGYGIGEESWRITHGAIAGDPTLRTTSTGSPWLDLDRVLTRPWHREDGATLNVVAAGVDSGHHTQAVYDYCRPRFGRRVFAVKGHATPGRPLAPRKPSRQGKPPLPLYLLGVDAGKDIISTRLRLRLPGPGYMHTPKGLDPEYYSQVTAERAVRKLTAGKWSRRWEVLPGRRNECLDMEVYALAALTIAGVRHRLEAKAVPGVSRETPASESQPVDAIQLPQPTPEPHRRIPQRGPRPPRKSWLGGWRQ